MSTEFKRSSSMPTAGQQRRLAGVLLLRLQWLFILLLIMGFLWLYVSQQRFQNQVNERLQSNEQVVTRLNDMDDRLFALNQQGAPTPNVALGVGSHAQNQLDLLRIQIQAAENLLADNNYQAALGLLRGLQWQLSQSSNEIAPALSLVIQQSLTKDIERLQAQSAQPSPWQLQNIAIQNIQEFLNSRERDNSHEPNNSHERNSHKPNSHERNKSIDNNTPLTRQQLTLHEVIMTLNLASQASNMREQSQLTGYLRQARKQLQTLVTAPPTSSSPTPSVASTPDRQANVATMESPTNISDVIVWLDKLIANVPTPKPLLVTQIVDSSTS